MERTHRWEQRSLAAHQADPRDQSLYAVVHGGIDPKLRRMSAQFLGKLPFDGYGIGGSVGKNRDEMRDMLAVTAPELPEDKPIHLLGIGDLPSIDLAIPFGIDTFDSSHPTKCARHGLLYNQTQHIRITTSKWATHFRPIEEDCTCYTCQNFTVGYLHHLFKAHEYTYATLASIHNISYMMRLMERYRLAILEDRV
jgi:queuine tRNA-ribosyltransferase